MVAEEEFLLRNHTEIRQQKHFYLIVGLKDIHKASCTNFQLGKDTRTTPVTRQHFCFAIGAKQKP